MITNDSTIAAIATGTGGAIGIIRLSGKNSIQIADKVFISKSGKSLCTAQSHTIHYGKVCVRRQDQTEELIDDVLISVFRSPHSYTGENAVEISCHGSMYIMQCIMQLLIDNGAQQAKPGEFTQRAFINGKMDLSQAEAVADLIASTSAGQHRLALNQMRGGFSQELKGLRDQLLHITSLMELELDFSDHEELEFTDRSELSILAAHIETVISRLAHSFSVGNAIKNGIPVAIIGETNAGKSTLLNVLLNEEKAIVSDIHGTTRDIIEDTINIGGITFRFIDTAGIRETHDAIESIGIERTFQKLDQANIVLWMIDAMEASSQIAQLSEKILPRSTGKQLILIFNKADLLANTSDLIPSGLPENVQTIFISAKKREHIDELQRLLIQAAHIPSLSQNDIIVTNIRHYEALTHALESIHRVLEGLSTNLSCDFISQDLRECIFHLSDIIGEVTTDQVLKNIFSRFCIGK